MTTRKIWLTGATSGIGKALFHKLLADGHHLLISARSTETLEELRAQASDRVNILPLDLADEIDVEELRSQLSDFSPYLDQVIVNAGTCEYIDNAEIDMALIERVMHINFTSTVACIAAALPLLEKAKHGGHLVGVSSASAYIGLPRAEAYGTSKAALRHFLQSLRADTRGKGLTVSIVYPGFVKTPLTDRNDFPMPLLMDSDEAAAYIKRGIDRKRLEIAFPWPLIMTLKMLARLPAGWSSALLSRLNK